MKRLAMLLVFLFIAAAGFAQAPTVGGVVNAGSYAFAGLPNAPIAQGALFVVFGTNMGPSPIQYSSFPLPTNLAGTAINITVGSTTTQALFIYSSVGQVAAVLPSRTPVGNGTLAVTFNGQTSAPFPIQVVQSNFGTLTWNSQGSGAAIVLDGDFQLITALHPAAPNQVVAVWGTGLGAYTGDETRAPVQADMPNVPVEVYVGTARATISYRGRTGFVAVDQINFQIPPGQIGCNVAVTVKIGTFVSNVTTMAVSTGGPCSDPGGISAEALQTLNAKGTISLGTLTMGRTTTLAPPLNLPPGVTLPPGIGGNTVSEFGGAGFVRWTRDGYLASVGAGGSVSIGGCIVSTFRGGSAASGILGAYTGLDAGASIGLNGPNGPKTLPKETQGGFRGSYGASLSPVTGPAYIVPGNYTFTGTGGADVGAFQASLTAGSTLNWTNQANISTVNRNQDLQITWSGAGSGTVEIIGNSTAGSGTSAFGATFICFANASAGQFTVPSVVLLALPPGNSQTVGGVTIPSGFLDVGTFSFSSFTAPGIDQGFAVYTDSTGKSVLYQ